MSFWGAVLTTLGRNRRVPRKGFTLLTTKQGPRGYYKGKGAASTGRHTKQGYLVTKEKLPEYVVPDLSGFKLKPFVAYELPK